MRQLRRLAPGPVRGLYRRALPYLALGLEPVDYLARVINDKQHLPPLYLRRHVGPLRDFETSAAESAMFLRLLCGITPADRMLDIGCGCGAVALQLVHFFDGPGGYVGLDVHAPSIRWAQRHLTRRDPRLRFAHLDVQNLQYNPGGRLRAGELTFPLGDASFDLVLLKSVFTHMRPPEVDNYLKEIARLLAPDGRCMASFFLLTETQPDRLQRGVHTPRFPYGEADWRWEDPALPERAIAYREPYLLDLLAHHGLELARLPIYGHQDLLFLQHRTA